MRAFEDTVRREVFVPETNEVISRPENIAHCEGLHNLYYLPCIIRTVKSSMRWARHGKKLEVQTIFWSESVRKRDYSEQLEA